MKTTTQPSLSNTVLKWLLVLTVASIFTYCRQNEKTAETDNDTQTETDVNPETKDDRRDDAKFMEEVAIINLEEIELGKLAQNRATSKDVKDFAAMMVDAHTKALGDLRQLAAMKGVTIPQDLSDDSREKVDKFVREDAKDFDKKYMAEMVDGHEDAISKFESAGDDTKDEEVKAWIVKMLPDLQTHLDQAKITKDKVD